MRKTAELSGKIGNTKPWFSYAIPFPGSEFSKQAKQYGKIVNKDMSTWENTNIVFVPNGTNAGEMKYWYTVGRNSKALNREGK